VDQLMGIAQRVARQFADGVRSRGRSYFDKGRVVVTSAKAGQIVVAKVRGTDAYKVKLRLRGGKLHASCTCLYFGPQGEPCKHIWATVLVADARQLLPWPPNRPLRLVPDVRHFQQPAGGAPPGGGGGHGPHPHPHPHGPGVNPAELPGAGYGPRPNGPPPDHLEGILPYPAGPPRNGQHGAPPRPPYGPGPHAHPHPQPHGKAARPGRESAAARKKAARAARAQQQQQTQQRPALLYVLDAPATLNQNQVVITLARRHRRPGTDRGALKPWWHLPGTAAAARLGGEDRELLDLLELARAPGAANAPAVAAGPAADLAGNGTPTGTNRYVLRNDLQAQVVERIARTGRCRLRRTEDEDDPPALRWDDGPPWEFWIDIRLADPAARRWTWRGILRRHRGEDRMDLAEPLVLLPGLVVQGVGRAARFDDAGIFLWMARLRHEKEMSLSEVQQDAMLGRLLGDARVGPSRLVEGLYLEEVDLPPQPCLTVRTPRQNWGSDNLVAELEFDYEGARVASFPPGKMAVQTDRRRAIRRDVAAEAAAKDRLFELGFKDAKDFRVDPGTLEIGPKKLPAVIPGLVADNWRVEAEGVLYRSAGEFKLNVTSGIDWFELAGGVQFGNQSIPLPQLLAAARRGETMIKLDDGSIGMLPEAWLQKYGLLTDVGTVAGDALRFDRSQAGLLDSLLAAQPEIRCDAEFAKVRKGLHAFEGVEPIDAPPGFQGELRPYQREGLGWLEYLRQFDFGGILADDMGLGKTVQVLALLQRRRARRQSKGPSLIVVPRSLVFNWLQEAAKFTPRLRVLDYTGPARHALRDAFEKYDLIVTTYGTMRSDIVELSKLTFDYAILDEAQAIKNSESQSAKAARLLQARHRLAMSGTPIENHLGELWSIFEFLNPGMLGTAGVFKKHAGGAAGQDEQARYLLARALKPFILRRTKSQVVKDLPDKIEQTLHCDMEPAQRKMYEDLLAHYRTTLLRKDADELRGSKIEVLEALLRLRQAACHPGLIDPTRLDEASAKLDMLLPQVAEVVDEGHKVLIFSQFTSFLAIVKKRLDAEGLTYEYLDGRTRNREERVNRFQTDPDCPIFLISLKAGGLGLNLTAAEYVYLLDPWWNPAVEAQAIDRSHRIGQVNNVFAYRLIAKDTVEQKILDLQQKKRELADAILDADNRMLQKLTREDLEFLLS
jgi:superfamily II DNA or RNA helicase